MIDTCRLDEVVQFLNSDTIENIRSELRKKSVNLNQLAEEKVVVFGAADEGIRLIGLLKYLGAINISCVDMDPAKVGTKVCGVEIQLFSLNIINNSHVVLATHRTLEAKKACLAGKPKSITTFQHLQLLYPNEVPPHIFHTSMLEVMVSYSQQLKQVASSYADQDSVDVLSACLNYRIFGDPFVFESVVDWDLYLPRDIDLSIHASTYVDCGSFDGDSLLLHIERYNDKLLNGYAFEPDPSTFKKLTQKLSKYKNIKLINMGVSDSVATLSFTSSKERGSSFSNDGDVKIKTTCLDECLKNDKPTFIKMNIEAFEPLALTGAMKVIQRCAPALAISAYHRPEHLFTLKNQIEDILPLSYKYYLRQHDGGNVETVLYAIPQLNKNEF